MAGRRALVGLGLILSAAMVLAVTARLSDRQIPGTATPIAVPGPPVAGQCLVGPDDLRIASHPGLPPSDGVVPAGVVPRVGACGASHVGVVVSVHRDEPAAQPVLVYGFPFSFQVSGCAQDVLGYLGLDPSHQGPIGNVGTAGTAWAITTLAAVVTIRPTTEQAAVGQHWTACVLTSPGASYTGSGRDSYSGGAAPSAFGVCGGPGLGLADDRLDRVLPSTVDCARPHRAEQFGIAWFAGQMPGELDLTNSCSMLVSSVTRLPDVTAGGQLTIRSTPLDTDDLAPGWHEVACTAVAGGGRSLTGTLVGVGDGRVPWQ